MDMASRLLVAGHVNSPALYWITGAILLTSWLYFSRGLSLKRRALADQRTKTPFRIGNVRVAKLSVYPIKSCRGCSVEELHYTPESFENDRKWGIIDAETHAILTARQVAKIVLITPQLRTDLSSLYGGELAISFPEGSECEAFSVPISPTPDILAGWEIITDAMINKQFQVDGYICRSLTAPADIPSTILSKYIGRSVHLLMKGPDPRACPPTGAFPELKASTKYQDGYPVHVASEESIIDFDSNVKKHAKEGENSRIGGLNYEHWSKAAVDIERFRPNIVFKGAGKPFAEDFWRQIVIGSEDNPASTMTLISKCARCMLPNVDPETGVRDAAVPFMILTKHRTKKDIYNPKKPCFGCYGMFGGSGTVRLGDPITVKEWADSDGV
ncbi:hypothetical protein WOLCODRAFT_135652 [Wolfiporia cocos MD-104 SS10]|uniref:MOSC domain-containing protein n=1 Tax=Wolfiporia cocos (strain MD-104) TaxID=742152 RepID=A0A2H3IWH2_WOLCO|nr:hypothetical protein WOLCODRAFT_135652 [Wolfiporia cocos MD-104 SS10]